MCLEKKRGLGGARVGIAARLWNLVVSCGCGNTSVFPCDISGNQVLPHVGATVATCHHGQRSLEKEIKMLGETATQAF